MYPEKTVVHAVRQYQDNVSIIICTFKNKQPLSGVYVKTRGAAKIWRIQIWIRKVRCFTDGGSLLQHL